MISHDVLSTVLHALVTAYPEGARAILTDSDDLTEEAKQELVSRLDEATSPARAAEVLGDVLRGWNAPRDLVNECYRASFYASDEAVALARNPLFAHFLAKKGGLVLDKWPHYFRIYDRYLARYRDTPARVLEVGVYRGGGLDLLRDYLGPEPRLVGIDVDPVAVEVASTRHTVELGDQTDAEFLARVVAQHGPFDVVIDDGGHTMEQQLTTARALLPQMPADSVYIVEDTHTSYWPEYGGGRCAPGTFLEWVKDLVDEVNAYHWSADAVDSFGVSIDAVHVHDSVVVLDIGRPFAPFAEVVGTWDFLKLHRPLSAVHSELVATRDVAVHQRASTERQLARVSQTAERERASRLDAYRQLEDVRGSASWRLTEPLRRWRRRGRG